MNGNGEGNVSDKILRGQEKISRYLDIGDKLFWFFMSRGLPVVKVGRDYFAHADNLDNFIRQITSRQHEMPTGGDE